MKASHVLTVVSTALALIACSTTREVPGEDVRREHEVALRNYEAGFRPSDYPPNTQDVLEAARDTITESLKVPSNTSQGGAAEVVQGYRVQVFSTTDFPEAQSRQAEAQVLFPGERVYLVYEPPTYKIRVGNFLVRFEAEHFLGDAIDRGFPNAWVVPEKVYKTPPPQPPQAPQKQEEPRTN